MDFCISVLIKNQLLGKIQYYEKDNIMRKTKNYIGTETLVENNDLVLLIIFL